jgi:hypothetical protein
MILLGKLFRWRLLCCSCVVLFLWVFPSSSFCADYSGRLATGEIITHIDEVPGSAAREGEAIGVMAAPPEKVWQVIIDVNNYQQFLPRMIRSRLVRFQELEKIRKARPSKASEVEALLNLSPPEVAHIRIPGKKYTGYFYGNIEVPWPLVNRWYIVKVQVDESQAALHIYTCSWSFVIGSLRENRGKWIVAPFRDNQTLLTYRVVTDPGGFAPKSLVEKFTTETLPQVIAAVRRRVAYQ